MNYFKKLNNKKAEPEDEENKKINQDEEEEEEKKQGEEDKKEDKNSVPAEDKKRNIPPLITSITRKRPHMTKERWMEMAQLRRWDVKISNISIENLYKDPYDPFVEFVIGGNFKIIRKPAKKGKTENTYTGTLGFTKKTEVIKDLEVKNMKMMDTRVRCEYIGSYFDIQEQFLRIDIWDWEKWNLNEFLGRIEIPLIEIIQGDVEQSHIIFKSGEKKKIKLCRLNFTISFQEIWDFLLKFSDWTGVGLIGEKGDEKVSPSIKLCLMSQGLFKTNVTSNTIVNETSPQWQSLKGLIHYRGTINDLQSECLLITLYDGTGLNKKKVGVKAIDLMGILDSGIVSTDLTQEYKKASPHNCSIKGRINIQRAPKFRQTGEIILLNSEQQYLCIEVMRIDNVVLPHDKGAVNTYVQLDWGGYSKRTRTAFHTYKPIFNDTFYFPINIPSGRGSSEAERTRAILKEFLLYSHIKFNFWSIDEELSNDSLGSTTFFLNELNGAKVQEKEFFDEKSQSLRVIKQRVWSGKKQLYSPFISSGEVSNLLFDVWVLYEAEKKLEYEDLPKEVNDVLPENYSELEIEWESWADFMKQSFPEETQREYLHEMRDEHDKKHFLPLFLSKLGYPNPSRMLANSVSDLPVDYLTIETLKENNYYTSLIPFSILNHDIWSSPEFLIHMKKGESEEHAILLACLMMTVTNETNDEKTLETENLETLPSARGDPTRTKPQEPEEEDIESRVFVCVGTLKQRRMQHVWTMSISKDYSSVDFWETTNNTFYELPRRVSNPEMLQKFLNKQDVDFTVLKFGQDEETDSNKRTEENAKNLFHESSSDEADESVEEEDIKDKLKKLGDVRIKKDELSQNEQRFKFKSSNHREDVPKSEKMNFLDARRAEEKRDKNNYTSIVQEPRLLPGASDVELPYRTIDVIFNNKNIFMNMQHFDPGRIIYDIYDETLWKPFIKKNHKIFSAFYAPPVLSPPIPLPVAKKLHDSIIKEIKIGVSALRSGKNLGTSWKNAKDPCVELMESHLKFLELAARGEFEDDQIRGEKHDWSFKIKQFMPTFYRMNAVTAHFTYPEPDRIASQFIESAKDFFVSNHKTMKWAVAVRIFPYVAKVISIRILVASFYPVPGGVNK